MSLSKKDKLDEIRLLYEFVPPQRLKNEIVFLFMQYVASTGRDGLMISNITQLTEDLEMLLRFIDLTGCDD